MRQYTTPNQTAKLIELGFEKPKSIGGYEPTFVVEYEGVEVSNVIIGENKQCPIFAYSIGELIEKLPLYRIEFDMEIWVDTPRGGFYAPELIDALFESCVKFKSEGVI